MWPVSSPSEWHSDRRQLYLLPPRQRRSQRSQHIYWSGSHQSRAIPKNKSEWLSACKNAYHRPVSNCVSFGESACNLINFTHFGNKAGDFSISKWHVIKYRRVPKLTTNFNDITHQSHETGKFTCIVAQTHNPISRENEAGELPLFCGRLLIPSEFCASLRYRPGHCSNISHQRPDVLVPTLNASTLEVLTGAPAGQHNSSLTTHHRIKRPG